MNKSYEHQTAGNAVKEDGQNRKPGFGNETYSSVKSKDWGKDSGKKAYSEESGKPAVVKNPPHSGSAEGEGHGSPAQSGKSA